MWKVRTISYKAYYEPQSRQPPKRLPRRRPLKVIPSGLGDEGIVGNWLFYYLKGGDHLHDFSPENRHGTLTSLNTDRPTWVDGRYGWALKFDGADDYVGFSSPDFTYNLTITAWVKFARQDTYETIISGRKGDWTLAYWFFCNSDSNELSLTTNGTHHVKGVGESIQNGVWYHLAVTYDGSQITYFLNGKQVNTASETAEITDEGAGGIGRAGGYFIYGSITILRIYSVVKSASWIKRRFERTRSLFRV